MTGLCDALLSAYVAAIDDGDAGRLQALFAPDALVRILDAHGAVSEMQGRDEIAATLSGIVAEHARHGEHRRHYVASTTELGLVGEDTVMAVTPFVVLRSPLERRSDAVVASIGEYSDRIRMTPEPTFAERLIRVQRFI